MQTVAERRTTNRFYRDYDLETFGGERLTDFRTPFQIDRDRIIYTAAFRRLQSKTQVFVSGEYDFYRTRLTHTIEVAQIGRSIAYQLNQQSTLLASDFYLDPDLVEAACLAHDLGHPPFGHAGERTLHRLMRDWGGFEGNAQTLRLLSETIFARSTHRRGMQPTRAFLDAILKYKALYTENEDTQRHFIYDEQAEHLEFTFAGNLWLSAMNAVEKNRARSIECQIMDWADDTAYCLNDMVDGIHAGFLTLEKIERWAASRELDEEQSVHVENLCTIIRSGHLEAAMGKKIGQFIASCSLEEQPDHPLADTTNRYRYCLAIDPAIRREADLYKALSLEVVFRSPQLQQLDYKADMILERIFNVCLDQYAEREKPQLHLLSPEVERAIAASSHRHQKVRLICDHMAGMTDNFATRIYKRLFDADFGSIVDIV